VGRSAARTAGQHDSRVVSIRPAHLVGSFEEIVPTGVRFVAEHDDRVRYIVGVLVSLVDVQVGLLCFLLTPIAAFYGYLRV